MVALHGLNNAGGTEKMCSIVANGLSEAGHEIVIVGLGPSDKPFFPLDKAIKVIALPSYDRGRVAALSYINYRISNQFYKVKRKLHHIPCSNKSKQVKHVIKKEAVDIVIAVDTRCVDEILHTTLGTDIKLIGWEHFNFKADFGQKRRAKARQLAAEYCDAIVTLSETDKQDWLAGTKRKSQISVITNPSSFAIEDYAQEDTKIVLAVGRLSQAKGFDLLLKSWTQVSAVMPEWQLKIVGEGQERAALTQLIADYQLTKTVELVGAKSNIEDYYKEAEIFCLSSRYEGFPLVLLEALSFSLPVVSFDCPLGPAEILKGTGSILVPEEDIDALASSLIELMSDKERRQTISEKSKPKAEQYQPEKIIKEWLDLLESLSKA